MFSLHTRKLNAEIFKVLKIQKRIVSAETTVCYILMSLASFECWKKISIFQNFWFIFGKGGFWSEDIIKFRISQKTGAKSQ